MNPLAILYLSLAATAPAVEAPHVPKLGVVFFDRVPSELKASRRAVVRYVAPDSPAERAGLRARDVLTGIAGTEVGSGAEAARALSEKAGAGGCVELSGWRADRSFTLACLDAAAGKGSETRRLLARADDDAPIAVIDGDCPNPGVFLLDPRSLLDAVNLSLDNRADEHITACAERLPGGPKRCGPLPKLAKSPKGSYRVVVKHPAHGPLPTRRPDLSGLEK